jgi:hypothetical protein
MKLTDHKKLRMRFIEEAYTKHELGPMAPAVAIVEIAMELQANYYNQDCERIEFDLESEAILRVISRAEDKDYTFGEMVTEIIQLQLQNDVPE